MAKPLKCGGNQRRGKRCCGRCIAYSDLSLLRLLIHGGMLPLTELSHMRLQTVPTDAAEACTLGWAHFACMPCHAKPSRAKRLAVQYLEVGEVAELIGYAADVRAITDRSASAVRSTAQLYSAAHTMLTVGRSVIGNVQARQPRQLADRVWYLTTQKVSVKLSARVRTVRSNGIAAIAKHQPALLARVAGSTSYSAYVQP